MSTASSDRPVRFGTFLGSQANVAEWARGAERQGYDLIACGEHVSFYGPTANSFVTLACAAGATTTIELMSGIVLLPLYPAALAAKLGAALDIASGGRYIFGVGVGGEFPREFEACGVPVGERGARANEALDVIRRLWTQDRVTFRGRFNSLNDIAIEPAPLQKPHPPIWVAGRKPPAMRRAARFGDGWLPYMYTPEQLADSLAEVRRQAADAGRDPGSIEGGIFLWSAVHEDGALARQRVIEALGTTYAQDFSKLVDRYALAGDPQACRARIAEYIEAGARIVVLAPATTSAAGDQKHAAASAALMASAVIPALRATARDHA